MRREHALDEEARKGLFFLAAFEDSVRNNAWDAVVDTGGYFVVDGCRPAGYLFGGNAFFPVASQQHNLIPKAYIADIGNLSHEQVHADPAANGCPLSPDQDMAACNAAIKTVIITHRYNGQTRCVPGFEGASVPDVFTAGHVLDLGDARLPGQGRFEDKAVGAFPDE